MVANAGSGIFDRGSNPVPQPLAQSIEVHVFNEVFVKVGLKGGHSVFGAGVAGHGDEERAGMPRTRRAVAGRRVKHRRHNLHECAVHDTELFREEHTVMAEAWLAGRWIGGAAQFAGIGDRVVN